MTNGETVLSGIGGLVHQFAVGLELLPERPFSSDFLVRWRIGREIRSTGSGAGIGVTLDRAYLDTVTESVEVLRR